MKRVTATANPLFRRVQNLMESAAARREARMAVLEGNHLLESCVAAWGAEAVDTLMFREDLPEALAQRMQGLAHGATLVCVATAAFERLSPVAGEGGVLSLVRIPDERPIRPGGLELWLDGIQDPGNAGGIVRTAAAAGARAVVFGAGSADPWSAKCLRGAMGGHFFCAVVRDEDLSARVQSYKGRLMAAVASGGKDLYGTDLSGPLAILLGAEGRGLSPALASKASLAVQIPMAGGTESLNVGAAAAVLCYERLRQLRGRS